MLQMFLRRVLRAIEPWYDWGRYGMISLRDETCFDGRFFSLEWLGIQVSIQVGRNDAFTRATLEEG